MLRCCARLFARLPGRRGPVRSVLVLLTVLALALPPVRPLLAAPVVDQSQTACQDLINIREPNASGQVFTAGLNGTIDQVVIYIGKSPGFTTGPLIVEIQNVVSGLPGGTVLGSATLDGADIPDFPPSVLPIATTVTLSTPAPIEQGESYALVLQAQRGGTFATVAACIALSNAYPQGPLTASAFGTIGPWIEDSAVDLTFQTLVTIGPGRPRTQSVQNPSNEDDSPKKETDEQRQQRELTNRSNKDDVHTEGNVVGVRLTLDDPIPTIPVPPGGFITEPDAVPYAIILNGDGAQQVKLLGDAQRDASAIRVGDYLQAAGVKKSEQLFEADSFSTKHSR